MSHAAGVWIDHRKAIVVALNAGDEVVSVVESRVEKPGKSGGAPVDDRKQRALSGALNGYYHAVIGSLRAHDRLLIFGPGETKDELNAQLVKMKLGERVVAVETEGRMTEQDVIAKVRGYFEQDTETAAIGAAPPP
jgi:hypothetical protein